MGDTIGGLLRARRALLRHTQGEAATALGVTQSTVSAWENGDVPADKFVETLTVYLDIPSSDVVLACYETRKRKIITNEDGLQALREMQDELAELRARLDRLEGEAPPAR